jgi:NTE family protein
MGAIVGSLYALGFTAAAIESLLLHVELAADERPRIGVSLGGGGARGLAHVGVLQVLEELRVPVDYIAGTSMGAIVGSLYALGFTAAAIESLLLHVDWDDVLSDSSDRAIRSFRRKQDDQANILGLEFGFKDGKLALPRSLASSQNLAFALQVPGLHTEGRQSFDDLPIPFRAVASNVETGEAVVLDHGSLFRAVRASMTLPLVFSPVESDSLLLIDGGLTLNNPVVVVRDMGADIVIAVSVDDVPTVRSREDLSEVKGFMFQLLAVGLHEQVQAALEQANIVIHPSLPGILMDDFARSAEAIAAGRESAEAQSATLQQYSLSPASAAAYRDEHTRVEQPA